ncbi:MAG TPA: RNA degradosome polyphosphate kinase, partial [Gammaproteobacteria bacterium]|nr:RNA degradosome polyphosphate kinase [Gammaproteobacteria bacterium]
MDKPQEGPQKVLDTAPAGSPRAGTRTKSAAGTRPARRKAASRRTPVKPDFNLDAPDLYLNRELTWLEFNRRVLHMAADSRTPLLERVKFLAIVSNNLDEFFMKRIGGLKQQIAAGIRTATVDGRTPLEQVRESQ